MRLLIFIIRILNIIKANYKIVGFNFKYTNFILDLYSKINNMARIGQFRRDTLLNWILANPVPDDGEFILIAPNPEFPNAYTQFKVGDGIHTFAQLENILDISNIPTVYTNDVIQVQHWGEDSPYNPPAVNLYTVGQSVEGGIVFYILAPGDLGYDATKQKSLIITNSDLPQQVWSSTLNLITGTESTLGTGITNTDIIVNNLGSTGNYAAKICKNLVLNGFSDWWLPSENEVNKIFLSGITGLPEWLWASTEVSKDSAILVYSIPESGPRQKNSEYPFRAIRMAEQNLATGTVSSVGDLWYKPSLFSLKRLTSLATENWESVTLSKGKIYISLEFNISYIWTGLEMVSIGNQVSIPTKNEAETGTDNAKMMTTLRTIQSWVYQIKNLEISELNTTQKKIVGAINELSTGVGDISTAISDLATLIGGSITTINNNISTINGNITNIEQDITNLNQAITDITTAEVPFPIGMIAAWPGPDSTIPSNCRKCDGSYMQEPSAGAPQNQALFDALGGYDSPYGFGSGIHAQAFRLPNIPKMGSPVMEDPTQLIGFTVVNPGTGYLSSDRFEIMNAYVQPVPILGGGGSVQSIIIIGYTDHSYVFTNGDSFTITDGSGTGLTVIAHTAVTGSTTGAVDTTIDTLNLPAANILGIKNQVDVPQGGGGMLKKSIAGQSTTNGDFDATNSGTEPNTLNIYPFPNLGSGVYLPTMNPAMAMKWIIRVI